MEKQAEIRNGVKQAGCAVIQTRLMRLSTFSSMLPRQAPQPEGYDSTGLGFAALDFKRDRYAKWSG